VKIENLLEEFDDKLYDELTLSEIYFLDHIGGFDLTKSSPRPFIFNMQEYYLLYNNASCNMSKTIICCNCPVIMPWLASLDWKFWFQ
jgi:hypothetical protein